MRLFSFKINCELYIILYPIQYIVLSNIEVIPNSSRARSQDLYLTLVKAAEEEILLIFPTTNSFIRQEKIGVIQVAKKVAKELDVQVRIEAHGGRIWAENNNGDILGNSTGATFVSNLPIRDRKTQSFRVLG